MKDIGTAKDTKITSTINLTDEQKLAFVKTMKIGYFREFYKQGLITAEQLEQLIQMQDRSAINAPAHSD